MSERPTQAPDAGYFAKKLAVILRDINLYTKPELYRELSRLAEVAKPDEANSAHAQEVRTLRELVAHCLQTGESLTLSNEELQKFYDDFDVSHKEYSKCEPRKEGVKQ